MVLFFYPRADTPGCTIESCGFRDAFEKFQKAGIVVLGISRDTAKDQKKFKDKFDLPYDLLADPEMVLIKRYGLLVDKAMYGKPVTGVARTTYVIGPDTGKGQRLLHVFEKVTPQGHAEEVFALLKKMRGASETPGTGSIFLLPSLLRADSCSGGRFTQSMRRVSTPRADT